MKKRRDEKIVLLYFFVLLYIMSEEKRGGPYTKPQQEKRRRQVHEMYFEKGRSAVSIARELGVNRNTVNEDVRFWCAEIASEFKKETIVEMVSGQFERFEMQRERLMRLLESAKEDEKLPVEKMIFDMEYKMFALVTKYTGGFWNFESLMFGRRPLF